MEPGSQSKGDVVIKTTVDLNNLPALSHLRAIELGGDVNRSMIAMLSSLDAKEWDLPTDCEGWTVKDIAAHLLGWAEALTSVKELGHQSAAAVRGARRHGNILHAQNAVQVDDRRPLSGDQVIARLETALPRFLKFRDRVGKFGKPFPMYFPVVGLATVRFMMDIIFTRDSLMHRIDIARATGRDVGITEADRLVVLDCARDWAKRSKADARLEMSGPAGFEAAVGTGQQATISGDALELLRFWAGRASIDVLTIDGDRVAAERWLAVGCPF